MGSQFLSDMSYVYRDVSPTQVVDFVNRFFNAAVVELHEPASAGAHLKEIRFGSLHLCQLRFGSVACIDATCPPDAYLLQTVRHGHCEQNIGAETIRLEAGQVVLSNPGDRIAINYSADYEGLSITLPANLFLETCQEQRWAKPLEGIQFSGKGQAAEQLTGLQAIIELICGEAEAATATPQTQHYYQRILASKLLTQVPHNVAMEAPSISRLSFERLVSFIEENIKTDIGPDELARHANMSRRSLYLLFEKHANMTPKNFIRQKKLERVYSTLIDPACQVANITAVALDYGFTHLGRFSEFYKSTFGMLPSVSLKERQIRIN